MLSGAQPSAPVSFTCRTHLGASVVDLVLSRDSTVQTECDAMVLHSLSDHTVQLATIPIGDRTATHTPADAAVQGAGAGASADAGAGAGERKVYKW